MVSWEEETAGTAKLLLGAGSVGVDLGPCYGAVNVELVWGCADDGAVFLMQGWEFSDPGSLDEAVVEVGEVKGR